MNEQVGASAFVPGSHMAAAMGMVDFARIQSAPFKAALLRASPEGMDMRMRGFARALLSEFHARGWPMFVYTYVRSDADQWRAFNAGHTKARPGQSPHNTGYAFDVVHYGRYWELSRKEWALVGLIGKEVARRRNLKVRWGGDWKFYDPAHWELADWKAQR